jgi:diguanylate cyclase (GGDEF)-like protein
MPLPLEREAIQNLTEELEVIIAAHLAWFKQLNRSLVCACDPPPGDMAPDAHLRSPFGQWYYAHEAHPLIEYPAFQELAEVQQAMHNAARLALLDIIQGSRPFPETYDNFIDLSLRLNTKLRKLQLDIIGELLTTDPLTGCATRRGMLGKLREEQERAIRIQRPCCVCLMDFDRFKRINDELGHPAGDAVLRQGMKFTLGLLRKYDSIYRYGGEEFLICLPGTPLKDAAVVVERIRSGLAHLPVELPSGQTLQISASFGLAEMHTRRPVEEAIANADMALIQAKENGRNRIEVWQPA